MIYAAVCDDEPAMLEQMHRVISETFSANQIDCQLSCFQSGAEMLKAHREQDFNIIFLDILMPDRDGFDIAKEVRSISDKTLLLFVTSQDELVYDSFDYHPFYFLRKGDAATFSQSLSDAVRKIADFLKRNELISIALNSGETRTVCLQDILYLSSDRNMLRYHLTSGDYIPVREQMSKAEEHLHSYGFLRIHKQYIVNMNKIVKLDASRDASVLLPPNVILPIGRKYREQALLQYREFLRRIT